MRGATVVAEDTSELAITDTPPVATPSVYTVFASRDGVLGRATASGEVTILPDVADLALSSAPGVIAGRWRLPRAASGARVTRTDMEGTTVELTGVDRESFADHDIRSDTPYVYCVRAEYPTGCSPGVTARTASPGMVRPVTDLRAELGESTVNLTWTSRSNGHVEFRAPRRGIVATSGVVPVAEAAQVGQMVAYTGSSPARIDLADLADLAGQRVLVPVMVSGAWAAIGDPVTIDVPLRPVANLRAEQFGPQVRLHWDWPAWAHDARIVWRAGVEPQGPADPLASWLDTSRIAYESRGVRVRVDGAGEHWFGVCVLDRGRFGPLTIVSVRSRPEVAYTVHKVPWFRYGTHVVSVHGPGPLPEIAVVAKSGTRPLALHDGVELLRLPGGVATAMQRLSVPGRLARPVHLRAFALDEGVLLRHPDPRDLVVG